MLCFPKEYRGLNRSHHGANFKTQNIEDFIKIISLEQYNLLKDMDKLLEKKVHIFALSSKAKEDVQSRELQFGTKTQNLAGMQYRQIK